MATTVSLALPVVYHVATADEKELACAAGQDLPALSLGSSGAPGALDLLVFSRSGHVALRPGVTNGSSAGQWEEASVLSTAQDAIADHETRIAALE